MKKGKLTFIFLSAITSFAFLGTTFGTLSWFVKTIETPKNNVSGKSLGAYFAYGDGISRPFGISIPRHLYNLAWLQYMGEFSDKQYSFELSTSLANNTLDMSGYILPPIGTTTYPFVGSFNGNGNIITNLTVSSSSSEIFNSSKHPDKTQISYTEPEIVGLFGVVGNLNGAYTASYSSSANTIKDLGIDSLTVKTSTTNALAGMAAGYVDATISNVAVNNSNIYVSNSTTSCVNSNWTENVSDYSLVGYATNAYKKSIKKMQQELYDCKVSTIPEYNANDGGDAQGWGGSINMKTIYYRIASLRKTKSTNVSNTFSFRTERNYYNGVEKESERQTHTGVSSSYRNESQTRSASDAYSRYNGYNESGHEYIGNYNVYARAEQYGYPAWYTTLTTDQAFLYLSGGHYENNKYYTYYDHTGYVITNGTYYLNNNSGSVQRGNSLTNATRWQFTTGSSTIYTQYNGTTYYLYDNSGTLGITTSSSSATIWTIENSNNKFTIYDTSRYLNIVNNNWTLTNLPGIPISDGTNYMVGGNSISNTTNSGSATQWYFNSPYIYMTSGNTTYYLRNNGGTLQTTTNTNNRTSWTLTETNGKIDISNNNYHVTYSSGWKLVQDSGSIYYLIRDNNNHYIGAPTDYNATSTNKAGAVKFKYGLSSESNSSGQYGFYYISSGYYGDTNNFLGYYGSSYKVQIANDSYYLYRMVGDVLPDANKTTVTGKMVAVNGNTSYYIKYSGGSTAWDASENNAENGSDMTIEYYDTRTFSPVINSVTPTISSSINSVSSSSATGPDSHQTASDATLSTNNSHMYYTAEDTTYFPLNVEEDIDSYISNASTMNSRIAKGDLDPKASNTGYIVSGSKVDSDTTTLTSASSRIRISEYEITYLSNSFDRTAGQTAVLDTNLPHSKIYTINTAGAEKKMSEVDYTSANTLYSRYVDSRKSFFEKSLTTSSTSNGVTTYTTNTNVYGLHFMDSTISTNSLVNGSKISILGKKCDSAQLPVNSIDFNLKQKGIVNFFAGSYYSNNNAFFSLHEVIRNNDAVQKVDGSGNPIENQYVSYNTIKEIKEIEEIWSNDQGTRTTKYANIYKYKNATGDDMYSVPYRYAYDANGNMVKYNMDKDSTTDLATTYSYHTMNKDDFDKYCDTYGYTKRFVYTQIGKQASALTTNRVYYFEFPMNSGEYCLGSVDQADGAYLLYLDIGANAAKTQRTIVNEFYKEVEKEFSYAKGVALQNVAVVATNKAAERNIDELDTALAVIYVGYKGDSVSLSRTDNDVTMTSGNMTNARPTLVGELMWDSTYQVYNIHAPAPDNTNLSNYITSHDTVTQYRRLNYYDWNVNMSELTITTFTDKSTDNWTNIERSIIQKYDNGTSTTTPAEMKVYNPNAQGAKYSADDLMNTTTISTNYSSDVSLIKLEYTVYDGITDSVTYNLEMIVDNENTSGTYYKFNDYDIIITATGGDIDIKIVSKGNKTIKINGASAPAAGTTITIEESQQSQS